MDYVSLGSSELKVSRICLGTMTWGTQNSESDAHQQLDFAFGQGINFIDTAEMYSVPPNAASYGKTEEFIGSWLKNQSRDKVVLATKVAGPGRTMTWVRNGETAFNRKNIRAAVEASLRRLQTDYIDLYQLHWPDRNAPIFGGYQFNPAHEREAVPIRDTLTVLGELIAEGKVRHIGLSNETPWGVMEFIRLSKEHSLPRIVTVQNAYSLLNRSWEMGLAEIGFREQVSLLPYSILAFGLLSGKYLDNPASPGRINQFPGFAQRYGKPNVQSAIAEYVALARRHGLTPAQLAQAFAANRWFVGSAIIGATSLAQLVENIRACQIKLSEEIMAEIEVLHLRYTNPAP